MSTLKSFCPSTKTLYNFMIFFNYSYLGLVLMFIGARKLIQRIFSLKNENSRSKELTRVACYPYQIKF